MSESKESTNEAEFNCEEYKTVICADTENLDKQVNKFLLDGWALYGNPYMLSSPGGYCFCCQALTKVIRVKKG